MATEGEVFRKLAECHKQAEGCCRQLAHLRGDSRWLMLARIYEGLQGKARALETRRTGLPGTLILPPSVRDWREREDHPGSPQEPLN
jgi:hypothetical protein